jgi:predicted alpha/beta hydrolase
MRLLLDRCAMLQCPAIAISISDDAFATLAGTKRLLSYFPRLPSPQHLVVTPPDAQVRRIGHFGFFRRAVGRALWPRLLAQLDPSRAGEPQTAIASGSLTGATSA